LEIYTIEGIYDSKSFPVDSDANLLHVEVASKEVSCENEVVEFTQVSSADVVQQGSVARRHS
jgi:hypothetical protein